MRRLNPKLLAAFEAASIEPLEMDSPGRVVEVPVPAEHFEQPAPDSPQKPKTRYEMVRDYLESTRQPSVQPTTPEVDVRAAADADARRNFGASMLAAGQAFTGNRRAAGQVQSSNAQESQALAEREARKRELEQWVASRERQRMGEAGLLGQALSADEAAAQRDASLGVQRDRLKLDETKAMTADENADADRALKAKKGTGPKAPKPGQTFKDASALRKEFNALSEVKDFKEIDRAYSNIQSAAKNVSAAGDLSLIFSYMKLLDPGSTVREGEFANAQNAGGVDDKARAAYNNVVSGQRLTESQRADFVGQSRSLYETQRQRYSKAAEMYRGLAERQGARADDVVGLPAAPSGDVEAKPADGKVPMVSVATGATVMLSPAAAAAMEKAGKVKKP